MGRTACTKPQCLYKGALYPLILQQSETIWTAFALQTTATRSFEKSGTTRPTTQGHGETYSNLLTTPLRKPPNLARISVSLIISDSYKCHWNLLTYSMEQTPSWKADRFSACQEIHRFFFFLNLDAGLLARSQYPEGPATGHLDTGFSWFPCVYKQMLRWFPRFQVATTCFSFSPPDLNLVVTNFMFCIHVK